MEKETIKENLGAIPEIKALVSGLAEQFKAYFNTEKKEEPKVETPVTEAPKAEEPAKVEFDFAAEFKKITDKIDEANTSVEGKFKAYDEKFAAFEAEIVTAKETISKQNDLLKKTQELVEAIPTAFSSQKSKDGVAKTTEKKETPAPATLKVGMDVWK